MDFLILLSLFFYYVTAQTYCVLQFNATGDGIADDTPAVRAAFAAAAASNGGRGTIKASNNSSDYVLVEPLPWYGGGQDAQQSGKPEWMSVIRSYNARNITLTGGGVIDGQGEKWWGCAGSKINEHSCDGYSRPNMIMFTNTIDLIVNNITLLNSPSWNLHLANTTNVHVYNLNVTADPKSHNTDGIDIDCSVNVLVENSYINTGDDAIAVKSGIDYLGRTFGRTTENVMVRNMYVGTSHGLSIGSEMSGGVRNVTFQNITVDGSDNGCRIKSQRGRGGKDLKKGFMTIRLQMV